MKARCKVCKAPVHWYANKRTGAPILIGGKQYGDCECTPVSWVLQGDQAKRIEHALHAVSR